VSRHRSVNCDLNITVSIEHYAEIGTVMHQPIPKHGLADERRCTQLPRLSDR
jgi:hypothetical protein